MGGRFGLCCCCLAATSVGWFRFRRSFSKKPYCASCQPSTYVHPVKRSFHGGGGGCIVLAVLLSGDHGASITRDNSS